MRTEHPREDEVGGGGEAKAAGPMSLLGVRLARLEAFLKVDRGGRMISNHLLKNIEIKAISVGYNLGKA